MSYFLDIKNVVIICQNETQNSENQILEFNFCF